MEDATRHEQRIVPNVWCNGNAEDAGTFYARAFDRAFAVAPEIRQAVESAMDATRHPGGASRVASRYPSEGLLPFQESMSGKPLTVEVDIFGPDGSGFHLVLINAGEEDGDPGERIEPSPAISFIVNFDPLMFSGDASLASRNLDLLWNELSEGGTALMPLGEYPFSSRYGWVQDRYGVSWQLMLTDPHGDPRPFIIPCFLFGGPVQNQAREAMTFYRSTFAGSAPGQLTEYQNATGPAEAGSIMFADFQLEHQWFAAMDAGSEQSFSFTPGISFDVRCDGQESIDRLWETLSANPEAEACGWLQDRFGVSWQIIPENIDELMEHPGAYGRLMGMKRIVISDL